jgi:glutamate N-acetyltransferase / amino-acid N-acetyltransferase
VSVTAPAGFVAGGHACGIKASGRPDLSLVATADGRAVPAAATFTANRLKAAPVLVSAEHLAATGGRAAAVILNSGNANAATGAAGREHAERMCAATAAVLGCAREEVLVCSTGLIGIPLPIGVVDAGIAPLAARRHRDGGREAAVAIMTTDTVAKEALVAGPGFTVGGMAKGAAMLAPDMATMLAVLTTDASADHATLTRLLRAGVAGSFNRMTVDGCTSTNDTVIILASGAAGAVAEDDLGEAIAGACFSLATQMVGDAEGATKVVRVEVTGAASGDDAGRGARTIAESQLVKCSWYGEDPYWGRIGSELGSAGIDFDPDRLAVSYGDVTVAAGGIAVDHDEAALKEYMSGRFLTVRADLGLGDGSGFVLTNDLSHAYIDENMGTS